MTDPSKSARKGAIRRLPARVLGAALLRVGVYREIAGARSATAQAAAIVVVVSAIATVRDYGLGWFPMLARGATNLLQWPVWAGIALLVGRGVGRRRGVGDGVEEEGPAGDRREDGPGREDWRRLLRVLGFARTPGILVALLPLFGGIQFATNTWVLVAGAFAIRHALDIGVVRAILAAVLGMVPYWIVTAVYLL